MLGEGAQEELAKLEKNAEILNSLATSQCDSAVRAATQEKFNRMMRESLRNQRRASQALKSLESRNPRPARLLRSLAVEALLGFWIATDPKARIRFLEKSWKLANKSLQLLWATEQFSDYTETFNRLSFVAGLCVELGSNETRFSKLRDGYEHARRAVGLAAEAGDKTQLTKALIRASVFAEGLGDESREKKDQLELRREAHHSWERALETSRRVALSEIAHPIYAMLVLDPKTNLDLCEEALRIVSNQGDHYVKGRLMEYLAKWSFYAAESSAGGDPQACIALHLKAVRYANDAAQHFGIINFTSPNGGVLWVHSPHTEHFSRLAFHSTDPTTKSRFEEKSLQKIDELLKSSRKSGSPRVAFYGLFTAAKSEFYASFHKRNHRLKIRLLRTSLKHYSQAHQMSGQVFPPTSWNRAVAAKGLIDAQIRLIDLEPRSKERKLLRVEALRNQEKALNLALAFVSAVEQSSAPFYFDSIGRMFWSYGDLLFNSHDKRDKTRAREAARAYERAAEWFERIPRYDTLAESYWRSAITYDSIDAHELASENFLKGSEAYEKLGSTFPLLREHSQDYALYLRAWAKIENSRVLHTNYQFSSASRAYIQASTLLGKSSKWNRLSNYYLAWSKLEWGENLSAESQHQTAAKSFRDAARLFQDARRAMKDELSALDQIDEKEMVEHLANSLKDTYCLGRSNFEEAAEAADREDYQTACEKFRLAAGRFTEFSRVSNSPKERQEAKFLSLLCQAWDLSSQAHVGYSLAALQKASVRFMKAGRLGLSDRFKKLAAAHLSFNKAIMSSRKFAITLDPAHYTSALTEFDRASNLYSGSGFKAAAHNARGRRLLLNANAQLDEATREPDQEKRSRLYEIVDTLLSEAAEDLVSAHQATRIEEIMGLRQTAQAESRTALRLSQILTTAGIPSANATFPVSTLSNETAAGLERFKHADIEPRIVNVSREPSRHDVLELEIEISNIGIQPIRMISIEDAIPEGTSVLSVPDNSKIKGQDIILKPFSISPSKTEKVKIALHLEIEGLIKLQPRAMFIDQNGNNYGHQTKPKVIATSNILEFLSLEFKKDNDRRLNLSDCGWKTMMDVVETLKIPKSNVYGEPRYGRNFGKQLQGLIKSSLVEYRIFPGERGRGGKITRIRINSENVNVRQYVETLS